MSDRIPGSSWSNPIWHGKWRIYSADCGPTPFNYAYVHDDCDGEGDPRQGHTRTIDEAKTEIDDREAENQSPTVREGAGR